ncbi:MAG: PH domain-containing protein [Clostridia bacterium]|nr:PH domain-containing protein [Clostridia bacterium]
MEFKVKLDFLYVFLIEVVLAFLALIFIPFVSVSTWFFVLITLAFIALLVFFNLMAFISSCKIEGTTLTYKAGVFKYEINTNNIVKVEKAKNIYPSLSFSIDRVRILVHENGKNKVYYVSVVNNDELIKVLEPKKAAPKQEEKVVKAAAPTEEKTTVAKKNTTKKAPAKKTVTKKENK